MSGNQPPPQAAVRSIQSSRVAALSAGGTGSSLVAGGASFTERMLLTRNASRGGTLSGPGSQLPSGKPFVSRALV